MSLQLVPLSTSPNQTFVAALTVDGSPLSLGLTVQYNEMAGMWMLSISDASGNLLLSSVPMVTGTYPAANILQQYRYLKIGSAYVVNVSNESALSDTAAAYGQGGYGQGPYGGMLGFGGIDYPDQTNLGITFQLWWDDTPSS